MRFLCRRSAISAALDEQEAVIASLEEMMKKAPADQSAKIGGVLHSMESGNTCFLLEMALRVFLVLEDLNTTYKDVLRQFRECSAWWSLPSASYAICGLKKCLMNCLNMLPKPPRMSRYIQCNHRDTDSILPGARKGTPVTFQLR